MNILNSAILAPAQDAAVFLPALIVLFSMMGILVISTLVCTIIFARFRKRGIYTVLLVFMYIATVLVIACALLGLWRYNQIDTPKPAPQPSTEATTEATTQETTEETTEATTEPTLPPDPTFDAAYTEDSDPANLNVKWEIITPDKTDSFLREETISFGYASDYFALPGIAGFRGDNYRTGANYGTAKITEEKIETIWTNSVGSLGSWSGIGWTGQPLVVQWDEETRSHMNMREDKKLKDGLVEVIATTLDGNIYFYDLADGGYTRDPIRINQSVKGTAALDPRGYPILYVGAGLNTNGTPKMFMINLLDNSIMYSQSGADSKAYRGWYALDSSPMICAEADTIIWPCESGILYTMKLNTQYNKTAGTLSIDPEQVAKTRYSSSLGRTVGYEASIITVGSYAYIGDNGGLFFCFDLNTMELIWTIDVKDDVNATPVFEWGEDGNGYLYVTTSMEYAGGTAYVYKINAANGDIIWTVEYDGIPQNKDVSGGFLSSPVLGKEGTDLEGLLIVSVARTPTNGGGTLAALDTETGETVWEKTLDVYTWSSPVAVYTDDGKGYVILAECVGKTAGTVYLMNASGEVLDTVNTGSNIEASPVMFNDTLVVGTRGGKVYGIKIS